MRALEVVVPCHRDSVRAAAVVKMVVCPKQERYLVGGFERLLEFEESSEGGGEDEKEKEDEGEEEAGGIVGVKSMPVSLSGKKSAVATSTAVGMAERVFTTSPCGAGRTGVEVHIWEETGESIARHIWYANTVFLRTPLYVPTTLILTLTQIPPKLGMPDSCFPRALQDFAPPPPAKSRIRMRKRKREMTCHNNFQYSKDSYKHRT